MHTASNIVQLVGRTPVVALRRVLGDASARVLLKLEGCNPAGTAKVRCAVEALHQAARDGRLERGGTVVQMTSGNAGIAMAMACAASGYSSVAVMPADRKAKAAMIEAYGGRVVFAKNAPPDDSESTHAVAQRLARENDWCHVDPSADATHARAHEATGREILEQVPNAAAVVVGVGTGATITGVARAFRAAGSRAQVVGAEPAGSVLGGGAAAPYAVEGIGNEYVPPVLDLSLVDRWESVSDAETFEMMRRLPRQEGLLLGASTGTVVVAALRVAQDLDSSAVVVGLSSDGGERYLGTGRFDVGSND